jgi:hypothetical protein
MTTQPPRAYTRIAIAIAVAAIIIGATTYLGTTTTITKTSTVTTTISSTITLITTTTPSASGTSFVTGTTVSATNTYFTSCSITGIGGFELRIVSDSTNSPVSGETVNAVDTLGCDNQTQVLYLNNFSESQGGWLTPVSPQAAPGGQLSFTVVYQGATYKFTEPVPPVGADCVTLHVPSGNVTRATNMSGSC